MTSETAPQATGQGPMLACDVGNSRVKLGLFAATAGASSLPACVHSAAFSLTGAIDWNAVANWLPRGPVRTVLAGANPLGIERVQREWSAATGRPPFLQIADLTGQLRTAVDSPERVGVDRLLNAVAANVVRGPRQPAVIVDSGTATTVDLVDGDGVFRGGAILPGFELAAKSLHAYTALLPLVSVEQLAENPRDPLGTNTRDAIGSGLFWGQVGAVRELTGRLMETQGGAEPLIVLTGGGAGLLVGEFPRARWEPHLSLQGLVLAGIDAEHPPLQ